MYLQNTYNKRTLNKKPILFLLIILAFFIMLISLKSPKLSLNGDAIVNTELNSNYSDAGATAKYGSKDISNTIETDFGDNFSTNKLGSYTITYIVKKNNKTVTATRTVNVVDSTAPEIKLNGNSEINIAKDSNYQELGCTATDNYDGDITDNVITQKEDINEDLFKDYIEAVSNEAISWEGIREQLVKYHGFRYVPKSELEESKVREIKFDGIGKWVLGSPLCLNFTHLDKIPSFYNPEGARGEDAFFSTWLENSKVIEMPVYHFHDAFLKYTNILNEKYPKKLRKIKMEDEQTTERFIKASIGWIRYKPLFIYLTDRKNYNEKIDQIREKLRISIPEVNKLFANSDLNLLLPELEKFNSSVKKDYDDYIKTDEAWKKVKKAMTENN